MTLWLYDPKPFRNDYLSPMYFRSMEAYAARNGIQLRRIEDIRSQSSGVIVANADYFDLDTVNTIKNNGCKLAAFSITDSSYISQSCREAAVMSKIDIIFAVTGIQRINEGREMVVKPDFTIGLEDRRFLPDQDWTAFNLMRISGRLKSLPYVHAERQPHVEAKPYSLRSQKALIRGGHHMRRFILCLKLMERDLLDINSGFITSHYFRDDMNPQFRYCDYCRDQWKKNGGHVYIDGCNQDCKNDHWKRGDYFDLGGWNNKCPNSFDQLAKLMLGPSRDVAGIVRLLNGKWLSAEDHLKMLARITFTSDLKWLFSIYAAQRFWDAAMVGCVNLLPSRTADQDYFPAMTPGEHYVLFDENLESLVENTSAMTEAYYDKVSAAAKELYNQWLRPTDYQINTNLLRSIFQGIESIL